MLRKILLTLISFALILSLCGCDFVKTDMAELFSPPTLTGDFKYISKVIDKTAGSGYTLKYPVRGEHRSAVVQYDIDGDGKNEAFAFYSKTDGDVTTMTVQLIRDQKGEWVDGGTQTIVASGVDMVQFCDLDDNGTSEILVGWQVYGTSEMQLAVYGYSENTFVQRLLQRYTTFITCDLNGDEKSSVLIIDINTAEQRNTAALYALAESGVIQTGICELDSKLQSIGEPIISELSNGKAAIYLDAIKGVGAVTEVLIENKGGLSNPLFDFETRENIRTLRSASYAVADINGDEILEIPVQENVPAVAGDVLAEKLYLTNWCSFDGENLTVQTTTMINVLDGYYFTIPTKWRNRIAILKDTENRIREIYLYDYKDAVIGESLICIRAFNKKDWENGKYKDLRMNEIARRDNLVFAYKLNDAIIDMGITHNDVEKAFVLY